MRIPSISGRRRLVGALALAALSAPASVARAQFSNEVAIERDGVRLFVRPSATIRTAPSGTVEVRLTEINARVDEAYGVVVDGQRYAFDAFMRGLVPYFNAISVTSLSVGFTYDGVRGCSGRVSLAVWRVGEAMTSACNEGSDASFTGYTVNGVSTSGVLELQAEVRRRVAAERRLAEAQAKQARADSAARRAREDSLARARASASRAPTAVAGTSGRSTPPSADAARRASDADAAERARADARAQAEAAERAVAEYERQRQERDQLIGQAADQLTTAAIGAFQAIAENRRRDRERAERAAAAEEIRVARYRAAALARYAEAPDAPRCGDVPASSRPAATFGEALRGVLSMTSCRTDEGHNAAWHRIVVPTRYWAKLETTLDFNGQVVLTTAAGASTTFGRYAEFWVEPGEYTMLVTSAMRGEIGAYHVTFERAPRSAAGDWFWGVGGESLVLDVPYELYDGTSAGLLLRTGLRPSPMLELIAESGVSMAHLTGEVGARVYAQGILGRSRFFAQGTYGYFSVTRAVSAGSFSGSEEATGTGSTFGLGWEFTVSTPGTGTPGTMEIGVYRTAANLTGEFEGPFRGFRLRIAGNLHHYLK